MQEVREVKMLKRSSKESFVSQASDTGDKSAH